MCDDDTPAWRELARREAAALEPVTIAVEGLSEAAIALVDREARTMFARSVAAFVRQFDRAPDDGEAELLARAVAEHANRYLVPELHARAVLH